MSDSETTEVMPPQVLRERVRREHDASLAPHASFGGLPMGVNSEQLAELLKPETLRRNADSLPVLAAFQEFLDAERRRTRNRMLALAALFLILLLLVGGSAAVVGLIIHGQTQEQAASLHANLDRLRVQVEQGDPTALRDLSQLKMRAAVLESTFDQKMGSFQIEQRGMTDQLAGLNTNVADLHSTIARLRNENAQLHNEMKLNTVDWQSVTNRVEEILMLLAHAPPLASQDESTEVLPAIPPPPSDDAQVTATAERPRRDSLVLAIIPAGGGKAVDWRIPLPSTQE